MIDHGIADSLLAFIDDLPPAIIHSCADILADAESIQTARHRVSDLITKSEKRTQIIKMIDSCKDGDELHWLAIALESHCRKGNIEKNDSIQLLWTGRDTVRDSRSLDQALLEVIKSAKKHLWILSYVVYGADQAISAMNDRINAGVMVNMVIEPSIGVGGTLDHDSSDWLRDHVPGVQLYWWPTDQRPKRDEIFGALHAKGAVADSELALISSANLTGRAMDFNLELGVLFRGGRTPLILQNQLTYMLDSGIFRSFPG